MTRPFAEIPGINGQYVKLGQMHTNMSRLKTKEDKVLYEIKVQRLK
jgi:hypothetical protein